MSRTWLIKVNATIYNIFGSARESGEKIPWHFEPGMPVEADDEVFFYLTDSKERETGQKYGLVDTLFKRFLFAGKVLTVGNRIKDVRDDRRYWTDERYQKKIESTNHEYAVIEITKVLYDYKITSDKVADSGIWDLKYADKDVYELDSVMANSIRAYIP